MAYHSPTNTCDQPIRIPKLAVRNRVPEDELENQRSIESRQLASRYPEANNQVEESNASPLPWSSSNAEEASRLGVSQNQPNRQSSCEDVVSEERSRSNSKKKKNAGVLGFLTLKEPSTKAWEEFAEAENEKAKQGGRAPSSQKLPDHVPKVNSKWDGMPGSVKGKRPESKWGDKNKRISASSANHGWADGPAPAIQTDRWSTQSNGYTYSDDQNTLIKAPSLQKPAQPQLEPLPELSSFPSAGGSEQDDAEKLGVSSSNPTSTLQESPAPLASDINDVSPVLGVHRPDSRGTPKPINFSRPLQRPSQA